jgi:hypothetical protein
MENNKNYNKNYDENYLNKLRRLSFLWYDKDHFIRFRSRKDPSRNMEVFISKFDVAFFNRIFFITVPVDKPVPEWYYIKKDDEEIGIIDVFLEDLKDNIVLEFCNPKEPFIKTESVFIKFNFSPDFDNEGGNL